MQLKRHNKLRGNPAWLQFCALYALPILCGPASKRQCVLGKIYSSRMERDMFFRLFLYYQPTLYSFFCYRSHSLDPSPIILHLPTLRSPTHKLFRNSLWFIQRGAFIY